MNKWISVDDKLPDEGVYVFAYCPALGLERAIYTTDYPDDVADLGGAWFIWNDVIDNFEWVEVTHWMPLPPPPEPTDA